MSTHNPNQIAPGPDGIAERVGTVLESKLAVPRTLTEHREELRAQEGLANAEPDIAYRFLGGIRDAYAGNVIQHQQAQPSFVGRVNPTPSWTDEKEALASFAAGTSGDPGTRRGGGQRPARPSTFNRNGFSPLTGLGRGERQNTRYGTKVAPEGGGRWHRNDAEVTD